MESLIPVPIVARKRRHLTLPEWYEKNESQINRCLGLILMRVEEDIYRVNSYGEVSISIDRAGLRQAMVEYIYYNSYSRCRAWL